MFRLSIVLKQKYLLALSVFIFLMRMLHAQPYYFKRYEVEDGLANNKVLCSLQDKKGFMWFGTIEGLCRFNGYTFKTFEKNISDTTTLRSNYITCLYEDNKEQIWVGTVEGLHKFNDTIETFSVMHGTENKFIWDVTSDKSGNIWFIASAIPLSYNDRSLTLFRYNEASKTFKSYTKEVIEPTSICTANGAIWVSTSSGLLEKYNEEQDSFETHNLYEKKGGHSKWIATIYNSGEGQLLISVWGNGIKLFDIATGTSQDLNILNPDESKIFATDFVKYNANEFWVATNQGIFIYNTKSKAVVHLLNEYNNPYSISDNTIQTLCKDTEGGVWIGTLFGGINYYPSQYTTFNKFFPQTGINSL